MGSTPIGLSASRGSAVLGLSKYKTPLQVYLEIQETMKPGFCIANGHKKPERIDPWEKPYLPEHAPLRWGLAMENSICDLVGGITDREKFYQKDFLTCHIDGLKNGIINENKTVYEMGFKKSWGEPGSNMIPEDYQIQTQHQSICSGIKKMDVNVLVFPKTPAEWEGMGYKINTELGIIDRWDNNKKLLNTMRLYDFAANLADLGYFHKYHCEANGKLQSEMVDRYLAFWNDNILKEVPPPVQGYNDIKWLIPSPEGEIEADEEIRAIWSEYKDIKAEAESGLIRMNEIKDTFAKFVQKSTPKESAEKGKLRVFAGSKNIFSVSSPKPGIRVSRSTVNTLKDDSPELYEDMKKTSFVDIMADELELTEKQIKKVSEANDYLENIHDQIKNGHECSQQDFDRIVKEIKTQQMKAVKSLKLTKLLSKDNIMKTLEKTKPELYKKLKENRLIVDTDPSSRLTVN